MNYLEIDSLESVKNLTQQVSVKNTIFQDYWFWIALVEFAIIILLLLFYRNKGFSEKQKIKADILSGSKLDFNSLQESFFQAKPLYNKLKTRCHPDRFTDAEMNHRATILFQEIHQNRYNYKRLCDLEKRAIEQLNINI
ncbi:hypothetical protein [Tannerella forsythia]|uniref:Molecular chaperone DnaJ n=1 Tax=Tannerella forsythia TaxID=28112 RepID=A0A3P1XM99_TANFO|nr:hypothetical protein [Tannerella forsythia]RRD59605.1 hypothetical protein EII40_09310 [Tannerella forsythia]